MQSLCFAPCNVIYYFIAPPSKIRFIALCVEKIFLIGPKLKALEIFERKKCISCHCAAFHNHRRNLYPPLYNGKQQSKQWTARGEPAPIMVKCVSSPGKLVVSIVWEAKGILLIDYFEEGKTITVEYFVTPLDKLKSAITVKRPGTVKNSTL